MDIIISVGAKISEYAVAPLGRQLGYLISYTTNVQNLTTQKEDLTSARARLQHRIDEATNNYEEIYDDVLRWRSSVDEITRRFDSFLNEEGHAKAKCSSCGSVLHLVTRHQLSRNAKKMSTDVCKLLERSKFDQISYPRQIESSLATIAKDYGNFDSRKAILEDIMAAVKDPNRSMIGFWGMGGIGKTMLAKEIARKIEEENVFSKVVMTVVSQTPNIKDIQQEIAGRLDLKLDQTDSVQIRADKLRMRLKQDGSKILLILDDVWKKLDLEVIGIHDGCKMIFTSRFKDALHNYMGIAENNVFKIEALNSEEAINLFKKIIAHNRVEQPDYKNLAHKIVGECAGLPISIATVAHALKFHMELYTWKDALQQLQSSTFTGIDGMDEKVYSSIRLSYDFLGNHKEAKSLLLLCALHKEDENIEVEDLVRLSMGCSLLQNIYTMSKARDRVNSLVDKLKSHCLLLDGKSKHYVKMHDVIRDVCISIAKEKEHNMNNITNADMYWDFVKHKTNEECKAVSFLSYNDYVKLPQKLECPSLELLLLLKSGWSALDSIPDDFFGPTTKLEALQMNGNFHILPPSFRTLQNLQTLCLRETYLEDIAVIGELKSLIVLDLSESISIKLLPKEIGQLRRLQLLDLRECYSLKVIEPNVISNLTQMEELYLPTEFKGWETEEGSMEERKNASVQEMKSLQQLTTLYLSIPSISDFPKELFTKKLETYRISIGSTYDFFPDELETSRWLHLTLSKLDEINTFGLNSLIKRSEYLSIEGLEDITNVVHDLDEDGFPTLKYLRLVQLPLLEGICHGNLPACSFNELRKVSLPNLTQLRLERCNSIEYVFCFGMAERLVNLKKLKVHDCEAMKCILKGEDRRLPENTTLFPKLETLELSQLPALKTLVSMGDDEGKTIPIPKYTFNGMIAFFNLKKLNVSECDNLKYLLSFAMAESLVQLEELKIMWCKNIEEVIASDEESGGSRSIIFEKLQTLCLQHLPNLEKFWEGDCIECPLLSRLVIEDCPKALEFISSNSIGKKECPLSEEMGMGMVAASKQSFFKDKVIFPNLQILSTDSSGVVMEIFEMSSQCSSTISNFPNLSELDVTNSSPNKSIVVSDVELFLHKNHNIHTLRLRGSFVDGHQQPQPADNELSNCLMHLHISEVDGVNDLFKAPSYSILFRNLKSLSIGFCSRLENIPPSFMAFHKLETLKICCCHRLTCLLGSSTAASLPQLKEMLIISCKGMGVVISDDEQGQPEAPTQLVFHTLKTLTLDGLPNLKSFYSGDKLMSFPNLEQLTLDDCPKMERFSHGLINTSASFNKIRIDYNDEDVEIREGDVNKTITKLWEDKCHLNTQQKDDADDDDDINVDDDDDDDDDDDVSSIVRNRSQGQLRTCESSRGSCSKA